MMNKRKIFFSHSQVSKLSIAQHIGLNEELTVFGSSPVAYRSLQSQTTV